MKKLVVDYALMLGGLLTGGLLTSQGFSFLTHAFSGDLEGLMERHAYALGLAGIGISCVTLLLGRVIARLEKLGGQLERELVDRTSREMQANA